eukprot:TRINITY_DN2036_c0_g1_i9.p3 TRINITY_DN2036_c0_g1~~TRINITY_DN2036_c0_g1_i9.p3  ORF type:complete len:425 (+),score=80.03 TRINITY_DN2036_c0_g1_i9:2936-4210(+)
MVNSIFHIGEKLQRDTSISGYDYFKIIDVQKGTSITDSDIERHNSFTFTSQDMVSWLLPSRGYLKVSCHLAQVGGAAFVGGEHSTLGSNILKMFKRKKLTANGTVVEDIPDWYQHVGNVETLVNFKHQTMKTIGSHMFIEEDKEKRLGRTGLDKVIHCFIPLSLMFNLHKWHDKVFNNISFEYNFEINTNDSLIVQESATAGKIFWNGAGIELWMPKVTPSASPLAGLLSYKNEKQVVQVTYEDCEIRRQAHVGSTTGISWPIPTKAGTAIKRVFVFAKPERAAMTDEPLQYGDVGITRLSVELNGTKIPNQDYVMDFTADDWTKPYFEFLAMNDAYKEPMLNAYETSGIMDYEGFGKEPIFCIDLTGTTKQGDVAANQANTLTVNIDRTAGVTNFDLFAIIYYDKSMEFDLMSGVVRSKVVEY